MLMRYPLNFLSELLDQVAKQEIRRKKSSFDLEVLF